MIVLDVIVAWIHIMCAVLFLGTMFLGTFVVVPTLRAHLALDQRRIFITHFIPRARRIVTVVVVLLVLSGITQFARVLLARPGPVDSQWLGVFFLHLGFAVVPVVIFALAPRILGAKSKEGLCCDPDADDATIEELAVEYDGKVKIGKVDVDQSPQTASRFSIRSIPSLLLFKNGSVVEQIVGVKPKAELQKALDRALV